MKKFLYQSVLAISIGALMLVSSCSKKDDNYGSTSTAIDDSKLQERVKKIMSRLPVTKIIKSNTTKNGKGEGDQILSGWDFSDPSNSGISYSSPGGATYSSNSIFVTADAFGSNAGGGAIGAGSTNLDINYTFCFSVEDA